MGWKHQLVLAVAVLVVFIFWIREIRGPVISDATRVMCRSIWGSEVDFGDGVGEQPVHLLDEPEAKKRLLWTDFFGVAYF